MRGASWRSDFASGTLFPLIAACDGSGVSDNDVMGVVLFHDCSVATANEMIQALALMDFPFRPLPPGSLGGGWGGGGVINAGNLRIAL